MPATDELCGHQQALYASTAPTMFLFEMSSFEMPINLKLNFHTDFPPIPQLGIFQYLCCSQSLSKEGLITCFPSI